MKIITFNLKNTRDLFYNSEFKCRIMSSVEIFDKYLPDIVGMQEITKKGLNIYKKHLNNYLIVGKSRHSFGLSNEYNPLFLKNTIELIGTKTYSLSDNINKLGKKISGSKYPRICTIAHILYDDIKYLIINTHLDHQINNIRKLELRILNEIIFREKLKDERLIILGDFNMNKCDNIDKFVGCNNLKISNTLEKSTIDYIFIAQDLQVKKSLKISNKINNICISDHHPILVEIE